jgi:pimeloyl-ACP methyl ester carboxylesterase
MDLNGDGRLDAIVVGHSGGESTNAQVFLERNGDYEKVLEKYQYVKAVEIEKGRLKALTMLDLGCCADYVAYETRYQISPAFSAFPVYQKAKASFGQMPRNRVLSTPRRVATRSDFTPLRSAPVVEDTTTVIYDAVECGNVLATYLAGAEGYAWSTEADLMGIKWWYVEMMPGRELDETLLYPKDDIPTWKMGWIKEVDLRVTPSPTP